MNWQLLACKGNVSTRVFATVVSVLLVSVLLFAVLGSVGTAAAEEIEIEDVDDLQNMSDDLSADYVLVDDIDASDTEGWNDGDGFDPIGESGEHFEGTFDGQGFTITGLHIDREDESNVGLFGRAGGDSEIRNVEVTQADVTGHDRTGILVGATSGLVENADVSGQVTGVNERIGGLAGANYASPINYSTASVTVDGDTEVGGLVGYQSSSGGLIYQSSADGDVTGSSNVGGLLGQHNSYGSTTVEDVHASGTVFGTDAIGGLIGDNQDPLWNGSSDATVSGTEGIGGLVGENSDDIELSNADATVDGTTEVGGLVGYNSGLVNRSFANSTVEEGDVAGGLVGYNRRYVHRSFANGTVNGGYQVGGLVGYNDGDIVVSYAHAEVDGEDTVGGLLGENGDTVERSYSTSTVAAGDSIGGLVGVNTATIDSSFWDTAASGLSDSDGGIGLGTDGLTGWNASAAMDDFYFEWYHVTDDYPELYWQSDEYDNGEEFVEQNVLTVGDGSDTNPYELDDARQLEGLRVFISDDYILTGDLDMSVAPAWQTGNGFQPFGYDTTGDRFYADLDGQEHTIRNLFIDRPDEDYTGFIGAIGYSSGTVYDLDLSEVDVTGNEYVAGFIGQNNNGAGNLSATGTVVGMGEEYTGGLVGYNNDILHNSTADVAVAGNESVGGLAGRSTSTIENSSATGSVEGNYQIGGLVGYSQGTIRDTFATGSVSEGDRVGGLVGFNRDRILRSFANGTVEGDHRVGGLVGYNAQDIELSYADANVEGGDRVGGLVGENEDFIENTYAWGDVTGETTVGGLVGTNPGGEIWSSYTNASVDATDDVGGLVAENDGTVYDAYWDTAATGQADSAGGTALPTSGLTDRNASAAMDDFYFDWYHVAEDYPQFLWENPDYETSEEFVTTHVLTVGEGTDTNPYELNDARQLEGLRVLISDDYILTDDLDMSVAPAWETGIGFQPFGYDTTGDRFYADLDGQNHTISNLMIDRPEEDYTGFIGAIGYSSGTVYNLHLTDVDVTGHEYVAGFIGQNNNGAGNLSVTGTVVGMGEEYTGGLVGYNNDFLHNSTADVTVAGNESVGGLVGRSTSSMGNVSATGTVSGEFQVGGLVGYNQRVIRNSFASTEVDTDGDRVGGLVGYNADRIRRSFANGTVEGTYRVGGLVGYNGDDIRLSYAHADVDGEDTVGGLAGENDDEIDRSYSTSSVGPGDTIGGLVGKNAATIESSFWDIDASGLSSSDGGIGLPTEGLTGWNASAAMDDFYFDWYHVTDDYPALYWQSDQYDTGEEFVEDHVLTAGEGTDANPYELSDARQLEGLRVYIGSDYVLTEDLDMSIAPAWQTGNGFQSFGYDSTGDRFYADLDGQNHTITNLYIDRPDEDYAALIGAIGYSSGTVYDLHLTDVDVTGHEYVGGFIGQNNNGAGNISVTGTVVGMGEEYTGGMVGYNNDNLHNSTADVAVAGNESVGGLAGRSTSTIENSSALGSVEGDYQIGGLVGYNQDTVRDSLATGDVSDGDRAGGLIGYNTDPVDRTFALGNVTGDGSVGGLIGYNTGSVTEAYAVGNVTGNSDDGGLIGLESGSLTAAFWDVNTTGYDEPGAGTGLTTTEMTDRTVLETMDFTFGTDWVESDGYPLLVSTITNTSFEVQNDEILVGGTTDVAVEFSLNYRDDAVATNATRFGEGGYGIDVANDGVVTGLESSRNFVGGQTSLFSTRSLLSHWRFDDVSGDATDYGPISHDGQVDSDVTRGEEGILGTDAYRFEDNTDSIVQVSHDPVLNPGDTDWTVAFWTQLEGDSATSWDLPVVKRSDDDNGFYVGYDRGSGWNFMLGDGSSRYDTNDDQYVSAPTEEWNFVVATRNAMDDDISLFVYDESGFVGSASSSAPVSTVDPRVDLSIGYDGPGDTHYTHGLVDEIMLLEDALDRDGADTLYFHGTDGIYEGQYSSTAFNASEVRTWESLDINSTIPAGTAAEVTFQALASDESIVDSQVVSLSGGEETISLDVDDSQYARINISGTASTIQKTWEIDDVTINSDANEDPLPFEISTVDDWRAGSFNATAAGRDDGSGTLGLGYLADDGLVTATTQPGIDDYRHTVRVDTQVPQFTIDDIDAPEEVVATTLLEVDVTVENTGGESDTQDVRLLDFEDAEADSVEISLDSGESTSRTLEWEPQTEDVGTDDISVATDDDQQDESVTVLEPAEFAVSIQETNEPTEGETLEVTAEINNTGEVADEKDVVLDIDGSEEDTESLSLDGGESETITLTWSTQSGDAGDYLATVTADGSDTADVTVEEEEEEETEEGETETGEPGTGDPDEEETDEEETDDEPTAFTVTELTLPDSASVGESLLIGATVRNDDNETATATVELTSNTTDETLDEQTVELDPDQSVTVELTTTPDHGDAPVTELTATAGTDSLSGTVAIESMGNLTGVVRNDLDEPLEGTAVEVEAVSLPGIDADESRTLETDEDGSFEAAELPHGEYEVTATADDYQAKTDSVSIEAGNTTNLTMTLLPEPAPVTGVVSDEDGEPASGVPVHLIDGSDGSVVEEGMTDDAGSFEFQSPALSGYDVVVGEEMADAVEVVTTGELDVTVENTAGETIEDASVEVYARNIPATAGEQLPSWDLTTDADGAVGLAPLEAGTYRVQGSAPGHESTSERISVDPGLTEEAVLTLSAQPGSVTGAVLDEDETALANASVELLVVDEDAEDGDELVATVQTDDEGTFTVSDVEPGEYSVAVDEDGYHSATTDAFVVEAGDEYELEDIILEAIEESEVEDDSESDPWYVSVGLLVATLVVIVGIAAVAYYRRRRSTGE